MISIIVPTYNEANSLNSLHAKLVGALGALNQEYEIIYVDDGSVDNSLELLKKIAQSNDKILVIRFKKNFGQTLAIQAGINHSKGEVLVFLDADLQNDPADIPKLLVKMSEGYDIVSGWRRHRKDPFLNKIVPSFIGNRLISFLFGIKIHDLGCALKAYKRDVIIDIRLYGEMHRLLPLYALMRGAAIAEVEVAHSPRLEGKTHYGWLRVFKVSLDLVTIRFFEGYSTKPIYFFGGAGIGLSLLGVFAGIVVIIRKIFLKGVWISPLLFISLMFIAMGIQFILMGLLAEIIIRKGQSEQNQTYLIKDIFRKN